MPLNSATDFGAQLYNTITGFDYVTTSPDGFIAVIVTYIVDPILVVYLPNQKVLLIAECTLQAVKLHSTPSVSKQTICWLRGFAGISS